jgi:hypothetical protein
MQKDKRFISDRVKILSSARYIRTEDNHKRSVYRKYVLNEHIRQALADLLPDRVTFTEYMMIRKKIFEAMQKCSI